MSATIDLCTSDEEDDVVPAPRLPLNGAGTADAPLDLISSDDEEDTVVANLAATKRKAHEPSALQPSAKKLGKQPERATHGSGGGGGGSTSTSTSTSTSSAALRALVATCA